MNEKKSKKTNEKKMKENERKKMKENERVSIFLFNIHVGVNLGLGLV